MVILVVASHSSSTQHVYCASRRGGGVDVKDGSGIVYDVMNGFSRLTDITEGGAFL